LLSTQNLELSAFFDTVALRKAKDLSGCACFSPHTSRLTSHLPKSVAT